MLAASRCSNGGRRRRRQCAWRRRRSSLRELPKGDALACAEVAGIMAAKRTSDLIPLCHPLPLTHVSVRAAGAASVEITAVAETTAQTGVEMEALTAASVAARWRCTTWSRAWTRSWSSRPSASWRRRSREGGRAHCLGRCLERDARDLSGDVLAELLEAEGFDVTRCVVPDEANGISEAISELAESAQVVLTTGGTGVGPRRDAQATRAYSTVGPSASRRQSVPTPSRRRRTECCRAESRAFAARR